MIRKLLERLRQRYNLRAVLDRLCDRLIAIAILTPYTHLYHADGSAYMRRYWLFQSRFLSIRLHEICTHDFDPHMHDHPWPFVSLLMRGGYLELRPVSRNPCFDGNTEADYITIRVPGTIVFRRATDRHRIASVLPRTWSLFVTGPIAHWWGFYTPAGKVHWELYSSAHIDGSAPRREAA